MRILFLLSFLITSLFFIFHAPAGAVAPGHRCPDCHGGHGASGFGALWKADTAEALCLTCHGPGGISSLKADVHTNKRNSSYPAFSFTCTDCHDSHDHRVNWLGGVNIKMAGRSIAGLARIQTPNSGIQNVVFESRGSDIGEPSLHSFADNDEDGNGVYDGVCEACHTATKYHRNNPSGSHIHNAGKNCSKCHYHYKYFLGPSP